MNRFTRFRRARLWRTPSFWAVLGYALLGLAWAAPSVFRTDAVVGNVDTLENYWNLWWMREALVNLQQNPFRTPWMQHPFGMSLLFHTFNPFNGVVSLPLQACCGLVIAFNLLNVLVFITAALGAHRLVLYLTHNHWAAFGAGLIFALNPYTSFHLVAGQTNLLGLEWLPWYVWALLRGLHERPRWLLLAAVFLACSAFIDWQQAVFSLLITGVIAVAEIVRRPRAVGSIVGRLLLLGSVWLLLVSPLLVPTIREVRAEGLAGKPLRDSLAHSTDLVAWLLPSPLHPLWGGWASGIFYGRLVPPGIVGGIASVGLVTVALALYALVRAGRRTWVWGALLMVAVVLGLGPYLQVNGVNSFTTAQPIPLPYLWFRRIPFMESLRIPSRFVAVAMLALAVLAGFALARLTARRWLVALLIGAVLVENWSRPAPVTAVGAAAVSPFFQQLGRDPADYAILDVPYQDHPALLFQTDHRKRTVGARIARPRPHPWVTSRFWGPLLTLESGTVEIGDTSAPAWQAALACQNVRYVVFYQRGITPEQLAQSALLEQEVFPAQTPAYSDADLRAYGPLTAQGSEAYWTPVTTEWNEAERRPDGFTYRWLSGERGSLLAYPCGATEATLQFQTTALAQVRTLEVRVNGALQTTLRIEPGLITPVALPLTLQPGENRIEFRSPEAASAASDTDPRLLRIMLGEVSLRNR